MLHRLACACLALACTVLAPSFANAQPAPTRQATPVPDASWNALTPTQKNALRPLEREWGSIDPERRSKWLDIAQRFPNMPPAEQARIQNRMEEWAKMSPRERGQARMNYREAQQVPAQERKNRWEAYQALPPDQREALAATRKQSKPPAPSSNVEGAKSNLVPNPSYAPRPKPVAPTVAQAQPGATTNLITKRPSPPPHQPAGLPKIAVTSGFVDQSTLLPKRGPQGAAPRSAAAAASQPAPRQ